MHASYTIPAPAQNLCKYERRAIFRHVRSFQMDINHTTGGRRNKLWSNKAGCSTTGDIIILEFEIWKNGGTLH